MKRLANFFKPKNAPKLSAASDKVSVTFEQSSMTSEWDKSNRVLCFNLSDLNFGKAFGVPNFVRVWLPHLVRHHWQDFDLRYHTSEPLPRYVEELLQLNGVTEFDDQSGFFQINFSHFQKRLKGCRKLMLFVHDFHALTIPWKYKENNLNLLIGNVHYSDVVVTYFPYSKRICEDYKAKRVVELPLFSILDLEEHCDSELAQELWNKTGKKIFYPSDCQPHKNHYTLIKAFAELRREDPDVKLVLTGFREDREHCLKIQDLIAELNLGDSVIWYGPVQDGDVVELYRACDIVVQASLAEGGAMIATEALSLQKAVCVAGIPQARAALQQFDTESVFWFEPLSTSELISAMKDALAAAPNDCGMLQQLLDNRNLAAERVSQSWL